MADNTPIEWTDATWNPITGCSIVSPGCTNCYAMRLAGTRLKHTPSRQGLTRDTKAGPVWNGKVRLNEQWLTQPLQWRRPRRIFVCAHGDLFAEGVLDESIDKVFAVMALAPQHTFQVLTKRAARMQAYVADRSIGSGYPGRDGMLRLAEAAEACGADVEPATLRKRWPLPNVWLGVSAERQKEADERIPDLLATPAAVRFVSAEPLLGPLAFSDIDGFDALVSRSGDFACLDWIIVGGESGPGARPMHPDWVRSIRDQCAAAGTAFFFKQWGAWKDADGWYAEHPVSLPLRTWKDGSWVEPQSDEQEFVALIGKKASGRLLDGVEHSGFPGMAT